MVECKNDTSNYVLKVLDVFFKSIKNDIKKVKLSNNNKGQYKKSMHHYETV